MFGDFKNRSDGEAQKRLSASVLFALLLFGGLVIAAAATAATPVAAPPPPVEIPVDLLPPPPTPEPEPEPEIELPAPTPAPPAPSPRRPRVAPPEIVEPTEISDEVLEESDGELANEGGAGSEGGGQGGTGRRATPAPAPEPELAPEPRRPRPAPGPIQLPENGTPAQRDGAPPLDYPEEARRSGIQGLVLVRCAIPVSGRPAQCRALRGPLELRAAAIAWATNNRFTPAALEDGTPVATWKVLPVVFRLTNI